MSLEIVRYLTRVGSHGKPKGQLRSLYVKIPRDVQVLLGLELGDYVEVRIMLISKEVRRT